MIDKRLIKKWNKKILILVFTFFVLLTLMSLVIANMNIEISKAIHLDTHKNFISDIYNQVSTLDNVWSEEIFPGEYVRVTFEKRLNSSRDITVYPEIISGNPKIKVYEKGKTKLIAEFPSLKNKDYNKVYLTNLKGTQDTFDLKIEGGSLKFDYITDPSLINFTDPTPRNNTVTTNTSVLANVSIPESSLGEVKWNWDGTNYSFYNDSLVLMLNFENNSDLWENSSTFVDLSKYGNNGSCTGVSCPKLNTTAGRYGNAITFDGLNDYIDARNKSALNNTFSTNSKFTVEMWFNPLEEVTLGAGYWQWLMCKAYTSHTNPWYQFDIRLEQTVAGMSVNASTWSTAASNHLEVGSAKGSISINNWYHVVAVFDLNSDILKIYLNGILADTDSTPVGTYASYNTPVTIGANINLPASSDYNFNGSIDEVRIYNYSLSEDEVYEHYISNLQKFNTTQWYFTVNQSKNATTGLDQGIYTYYISVKDVAGNENRTEERTINTDATVPTVDITFPTNNSYQPSPTADINYTVTDNVGIKSCWYSNDTMARNMSLGTAGSCVNITNITWSQGQHNVTIWANDSAGNEDHSTVSFWEDSIFPVVHLISPANNTLSTSLNWTFTCNITDTQGINSLELYIWNFSDKERMNNLLNTWSSTVNGINDGGDDEGYDVAVDPNDDNSIYIAGTAYFRTITADFYVSKWNSTGTNLWNATVAFGGGSLQAKGVAVDPSNSSKIYVTGLIGYGDIHLAQFNSSGQNLWNRSINGPQNDADIGMDVAVDSQGNVYVTGQSEWGSTYSMDLYLGKWNSTGTNLWNVTLDSPQGNYDIGYAVAIDPNNDSAIYVAGTTYWANNISMDAYLGKWNSSGKQEWNRTVDITGDDRGYGVAVDESGDVYFAGSTQGNQQLYLGKWNSSGNNLWNETLLSPVSNSIIEAYDVITDSQGNVYVTGYANWSSNYDIYIGKWNSSGSHIWNSSIINQDSSHNKYGEGIALDSSGNIYVVGHLDWYGNTSSSDIYFGKFIDSTKRLSGTSNSSSWNINLPSNGIYLWNCLGTDIAGNQNWSYEKNYTITADADPPIVNITYPLNNIGYQTTVDINYTVLDLSLKSCWYSNDTMLRNMSLGTGGSCANITNITWSQGQHNVTIWVNDSVGNVANDTVSFWADSIFPTTHSVFPPYQNIYLTYATSNQTFTCNVTDTLSVADLELYIWNSSSDEVFTSSSSWNATLNGPQNQEDRAYGVSLDSLDNVYVVGSSAWDEWYNSSYIGKWDSSGRNLWNKTFNPPKGNSSFYAVAVDPTNETAIYVTGEVDWRSTNSDIYLGKFNSSGNNLWNRTISGTTNLTSWGYGVAVYNDSSIYVAGGLIEDGNVKIYLGKWNSTGTNLWNSSVITNTSWGYGYGVALDSQGNIYVTGMARVSGRYDLYLGKFNYSGTNLWNATFNGVSNLSDESHDVAVDPNNDSAIYVTGKTYTSNHFDIYLGKWNSSGQQEWNQTVDMTGVGGNGGYGITIGNRSDIYVIGNVNLTSNNDIYIGEWNSSGQQKWNKTINGLQNSDDQGGDIEIDSSNDHLYIVGGSRWTNDSYFDIFISRMNLWQDLNSSGTYGQSSWIYNFTSLGDYTWSCLGTDIAGNQNWSAEGNRTVRLSTDITFPQIHLISPADYLSSDNTNQTFYCSISDNINVSTLELYIWNATSKQRVNDVNRTDSWNVTFDGRYNDTDIMYESLVDSEGNVYVAGDISWTSTTYYDVFVGKWNSSGNNLWNHTVNGPKNKHDIVRAAALDSQGNIYLAGGSFWDSDYSYDFYLSKWNSTGTNLWNKTFDGPQGYNDVLYGVTVDPNNDSAIFVTGYSAWSSNGTGYDVYLGKYNSSGQQEWNKTVNGPKNDADAGYAVTVDNQGNVYVNGYSNWGSTYTYDMYIGKWNSTGTNVWNATYDSYRGNDDVGTDIKMDPLDENYFYVSAYSYWSSNTTGDLYLGKYNSSGTQIWNATINGPGNDHDSGTSIATDPFGNVYVAGYAAWSASATNDLYLGKFNSSGTNLWNRTFDGIQKNNDTGRGIALDSYGNVYVAGSSFWDSASTSDGLIIKYNQLQYPVTGLSSQGVFDYNFTANGLYLWNCLGTDWAGNQNWSQEGNYTFLINPNPVEQPNDVGEYSSLALDSQGNVHISYYDATNAKLKYCNNSDGTWTCHTIDSSSGSYTYTSLAIDSNDVIHISYQNSSKLGYCNNSGGSWSCAIADSSESSGALSSIAIDTNDEVHIAHYDFNTYDIRYCNNTGGSWSCAVVLVGLQKPSLAVDSNNLVHIAGSYGSNLEYCNNSGGTWNCVTVVSDGGSYNAIAIDRNDKIHISRIGSSGIRYCNNTGGTWSCNTIDSMSQGSTSIALDWDNFAHISYYDSTNQYLKYCNNTEVSWTCSNIEYVSPDYLGSPNGRALAIKKGRIVDSTSYSTYVHGSYYSFTDLMYWNRTIDRSDTSFPVVHEISPANNTNSANLNQTFSCNITDNVGISSLELYIWNSSKARINNVTTLTPWNKTLIRNPQSMSNNGYDVEVDPSNNSAIYATGWTLWSSPSHKDLYLGKWNSSGQQEWNRTLNGPQNAEDQGYGIAIDNNSNIYVVGYSYWTTNGTYDIYLGKWNSTGNNLWNRTINGPQNDQDYGYGVAVDSQGDIYVTGKTNWVTADVFDIYIGKWNSTGTNLWNKTMSGLQDGYDCSGYGIAVDPNNDTAIYLTGYAYWNSASASDPDLYLGKWNSSGKQEWNRTIDGPEHWGDEVGYGVEVDPQGNVYVAGQSYWNLDIPYQLYLGKWNSTGNNLWNATGLWVGQDIAIDFSGNVYITGDYLNDIQVTKFNSSGKGIWNKTINGPQNDQDYGYGVAVDSQDNVYITGTVYWSSAGYTDLYLGKFNQLTQSMSGTYATASWNHNFSISGTYTWNCLGTDLAGNQNWSHDGNWTLTITSDSCTYTPGSDWWVNCQDNCVILTNVNGGGNEFTMNGTGTFTLDANITNFVYYRILNGCNVTCRRGCINYD